MKIAVIGAGYVGLITGACLADLGHHVTCLDVDEDKIKQLSCGTVLIYEPGLAELISSNSSKRRLTFSADMGMIREVDVCFIAVGTPMGEDGAADLQYVLAAARTIGDVAQENLVVINKSTVPVGTTDQIAAVIHEGMRRREVYSRIPVVSNPEFLREGTAIQDFMEPDRIIIGTNNERALAIMRDLYAPLVKRTSVFMTMDARSAELSKYASNVMLAMKVSFINVMANLCEKTGADVECIREAMGSDKRIGKAFLQPGIGYGGSCFPKDINAMVSMCKANGVSPGIFAAVECINEKQKAVFVEKVVSDFGEDLSGKTLALWGLSFKPGTDDMREAPSLKIIKDLTAKGAKIRAYDPQAMDLAKSFYLYDVTSVTYGHDKYEVLDDADALLLLTEWSEFKCPDFAKVRSLLRHPYIYDGRNQFSQRDMQAYGFYYRCIGRMAIEGWD